MWKLEFSARQSDVLFASHTLTSIRSNLANILAMFEDTNGSPFSSRTRDIRSSKTSSAIYEPGLTATIYFANLSLFITSGIRETLVRVMLSPSFVNRFHIFVPCYFLKATLPEISIILRNCRSHCAIAQNLKGYFHISSSVMQLIFITCINFSRDLIHMHRVTCTVSKK